MQAVPWWWRCWCGLPSPSTCHSKISPGSFLCPLILSFQATKGQAADWKSGPEGCGGALHASHTPNTTRQPAPAMTSQRPALRINLLQLGCSWGWMWSLTSVEVSSDGPRLLRSRPQEQISSSEAANDHEQLQSHRAQTSSGLLLSFLAFPRCESGWSLCSQTSLKSWTPAARPFCVTSLTRQLLTELSESWYAQLE